MQYKIQNDERTSHSVSDIYHKLEQLLDLKRPSSQPINSFIEEFEQKNIQLENVNFKLDKMFLSFLLVYSSNLGEVKTKSILPQSKFNPDTSQDISAQILDNLFTITDEKRTKNELINESIKSEIFLSDIDNSFKTSNVDKFTIEDATKCVVNAANTLNSATMAIKSTSEQMEANVDIKPMQKATLAVEEAAKALGKVMLMWKDSSSGERYRMSLKKDEQSDFVMKIEPDIGMKLNHFTIQNLTPYPSIKIFYV